MGGRERRHARLFAESVTKHTRVGAHCTTRRSAPVSTHSSLLRAPPTRSISSSTLAPSRASARTQRAPKQRTRGRGDTRDLHGAHTHTQNDDERTPSIARVTAPSHPRLIERSLITRMNDDGVDANERRSARVTTSITMFFILYFSFPLHYFLS